MYGKCIALVQPVLCVAAVMAIAGAATYFVHSLQPTLTPIAPASVPALRPAGPRADEAPRPPAVRAPIRLDAPASPGGSFRIWPGATIDDVLTALARNPRVTYDLADMDPNDLPRRLGLAAAHAEGQFLPASYRAGKGRPASEILREAHDRLRRALADAWHRRSRGLPYARPYEALIVASIVEKETVLDVDRPRVAAVFARRLVEGMRLQADPTVIYGLGDAPTGRLTRSHVATDHPYNTYRRHGLPPTPIALPSREAIEATLQPADISARYFVARGDGSSQFSDTLAEHNAAVRRYLRPHAANAAP